MSQRYAVASLVAFALTGALLLAGCGGSSGSASCTPVTETCNGADDDCDGGVDDVDGAGTACSGGGVATTGACTAAWSCLGAPGPGPSGLTCSQVVGPTSEICDGLDNDCDGSTDTASGVALSRACYDGPVGADGVGSCVHGSQSCVAGAWGSCEGQVLPAPETCNDEDEDCDGITDDAISDGSVGAACCPTGDVADCTNTGAGARCSTGATVCSAGAILCSGGVAKDAETCNGIDDDCDGGVDAEDADVAVPPNTCAQAGECAGTSPSCTGAGGWRCLYGPGVEVDASGAPVATEQLCDGLDGNCDGRVDETFSLVGQPCADDGVGACRGVGTYACGADHASTVCNITIPGASPVDEVCSGGIDDDCDGLVDAADPDCPWSHTVAIDGANDFTAQERFSTTSGGYQGWITWDADALYLGYEGAAVASGSGSRWLLVYLGATGAGTATGIMYDTQAPALPFAATHHFRLKTNLTYSSLRSFDGATWIDLPAGTVPFVAAGTFVELRIPRAALGAPTTLAVHVSMIDEQAGAEWTWGGIPSSSFADGYDPDYGKYFLFDLEGSDAPGSSLAR